MRPATETWRYSFVREAPTHPYGDAVARLREFEGARCLWRVALGGTAFALLPIFAVAGLVAGTYLAADVSSPVHVTLGAMVALGVPIFGASVWRKAPWRRLVADPLSRYEWSDGPQDINTVIRPEDFLPAFRALRRAKLNPIGATRMPAAPSDAPGLTCKLIVGRSAYHWPEGSPELFDQIKDCLRSAGIRARAGGEDINADA